VPAYDEVAPAADLRRVEERVGELGRLLGRKTLEAGVPKKARQQL